MKRLMGSMLLVIALQGSAVALDANVGGSEQERSVMAFSKEDVNSKGALSASRKGHHHSSSHASCNPGPTGPRGYVGPAGEPGPDFGQYACMYNNVSQTLTAGQNVLFANTISLAGITYNSTTGEFTLQPGTYSVGYFCSAGTFPGSASNLNLVANGTIIPNSPLGGIAAVVTLSSASNTLALQARTSVSMSSAASPLCNVMITIYQID